MSEATWLRFVRAGVHYALRRDLLVGVVPRPLATRVPGAPTQVIGLVAWRGGVLPLLEPGVELDADDLRDTELQATVVVRAGSGLIALAADTVLDVSDDTSGAQVIDPIEALARCRNRVSANPPQPHDG